MMSSEIWQHSVPYHGGSPSWSVALLLARGRLLPTGSRKKPSWRRRGRCLGRPAPPAGRGGQETRVRGRRRVKNSPQASASASSASFYSDVCSPLAQTQRPVADPIRMTIRTICAPVLIREEESRISLASFFYAQWASTLRFRSDTLCYFTL